jgi:phosphoribosylaminoimidazole-succinocarboxamide synthase
MSDQVVMRSVVPGLERRMGKVRDVYDLGDKLAVVTTDRISAFDWVMTSGIPGKGVLLTQMTRFWLDWLKVPNHFITAELSDLPPEFQKQPEIFEGRTMLVKKAEVIPFECVARGYLMGTGWKEYCQSGTVCGIPLPSGLHEASQLPEPIFTPATKSETGHDQNISFDEMANRIGFDLANDLRMRTLDVYRRAAEYALPRGVIIADTKLEWGRLPTGEIILIDEVLTPDSSRFWPVSQYQPGRSPPSFDKQFLRDWLETTNWDKNSAPPPLPEEIVQQTAAKYQEALRLLQS